MWESGEEDEATAPVFTVPTSDGSSEEDDRKTPARKEEVNCDEATTVPPSALRRDEYPPEPTDMAAPTLTEPPQNDVQQE